MWGENAAYLTRVFSDPWDESKEKAWVSQWNKLGGQKGKEKRKAWGLYEELLSIALFENLEEKWARKKTRGKNIVKKEEW